MKKHPRIMTLQVKIAEKYFVSKTAINSTILAGIKCIDWNIKQL